MYKMCLRLQAGPCQCPKTWRDPQMLCLHLKTPSGSGLIATIRHGDILVWLRFQRCELFVDRDHILVSFSKHEPQNVQGLNVAFFSLLHFCLRTRYSFLRLWCWIRLLQSIPESL